MMPNTSNAIPSERRTFPPTYRPIIADSKTLPRRDKHRLEVNNVSTVADRRVLKDSATEKKGSLCLWQ